MKRFLCALLLGGAALLAGPASPAEFVPDVQCESAQADGEFTAFVNQIGEQLNVSSQTIRMMAGGKVAIQTFNKEQGRTVCVQIYRRLGPTAIG